MPLTSSTVQDDGTGHSIALEYVIKQHQGMTLYKALRTPSSLVSALPLEVVASESSGADGLESSPLALPIASSVDNPLSHAVALREFAYDQFKQCDSSNLWKSLSMRTTVSHPNFVILYAVFEHGGAGTLGSGSTSTRPSPSPSSSLSGSIQLQQHRQSLQRHHHHWAPTPSLCVVEEYVEGCSVADYLVHVASQSSGGGPMTQQRIASVAYDVLRALRYLHEDCRCVHRGVNSSSILLDKRYGRAKLMHLWLCGEPINAVEGCCTIIGSLGWMAPEVISGGVTPDVGIGESWSYGYAVDIWSLGVTILEMALGQLCNQTRGFSYLISEMSRMSCSAHAAAAGATAGTPPTATTSSTTATNSASTSLNCGSSILLARPSVCETIRDGVLLDFIALCLRIDPVQRPSARQLLQHEFLTVHKASQLGERSRAISGIVDAVEQRVGSYSTPQGQFESHASAARSVTTGGASKGANEWSGGVGGEGNAGSEMSSNVVGGGGERSKSFTQVKCSPAVSEESREQPKWVIPPTLSSMLSCDALPPGGTAAAALPTMQTSDRQVSGGKPGHKRDEGLRPLFETVIGPATDESRDVFRKLVRALKNIDPIPQRHSGSNGGSGHTAADVHHGTGDHDDSDGRDDDVLRCLTELQQSNVNTDQINQLFGILARALEAVNAEDSSVCSEISYSLLSQMMSSSISVRRLHQSALGMQHVLAEAPAAKQPPIQKQQQQQPQVFNGVSNYNMSASVFHLTPRQSPQQQPSLQSSQVRRSAPISLGALRNSSFMPSGIGGSPTTFGTTGEKQHQQQQFGFPSIMPVSPQVSQQQLQASAFAGNTLFSALNSTVAGAFQVGNVDSFPAPRSVHPPPLSPQRMPTNSTAGTGKGPSLNASPFLFNAWLKEYQQRETEY